MNKDCEVCQKLIKEKHRHDFAWKVAAIIFLIIAIIFAVLYFGSGAVITETTIQIGNDSQIDGSVSDLIIGSESSTISGTVETADNTGLFIFAGIVIGALIIAGGVIIAHHNKKDD